MLNSRTSTAYWASTGLWRGWKHLPLIREHTRRALEIDPSLPEGRAMLGTAAMFDFDWPEAERQFRLAMSHGAIAPRVRRYYAHYCLLPTGRAQEAVEQYRLGLREDPLNLQFRIELAVCLRAAGRLAESDEELRGIMRIDETFWFPYFVLGVNRALDGHLEEAVAISERAFQLAPWFTPIIGFRRRCCDAPGRRRRRSGCMPITCGPPTGTLIRSG